MKENDLKIEMNWDRDAILENEDPTRHLLVEISAPDGERSEKTEPLNLLWPSTPLAPWPMAVWMLRRGPLSR